MRTPFFDLIKNQGAFIANFGDWEMPIYFTSIKEEHNAVRNNAGIFDVSHMGTILIEGPDAVKFCSYLLPNDIESPSNNKAIYSPMCNHEAGIIDDVIVYKQNHDKCYLIVNASNVEKDFNWIKNNINNKKIKLENLSPNLIGIALQGPKSDLVLEKIFNKKINISYYSFIEFEFMNIKTIIARTGYTGEKGYEIWFENKNNIVNIIWDILVNKEKITLCGLGSRDTLRLESGYALYGHELDESTNPYEASLDWTIKSKTDFIGKKVLDSIDKNNLNKKLIGIEMIETGIPRNGYKIYSTNNLEIGIVTSGTYSFTLNKNIALVYLKPEYSKIGTEVFVEIRNKKIKAVVKNKIFYYNPNIKSN